MFDRQQNMYVPTIAGLGMHVEIRDPDDNMIISRVRDPLNGTVLLAFTAWILLLVLVSFAIAFTLFSFSL
jgi:hypothetical protein